MNVNSLKKVGIIITYYHKFDKFIIPCLHSILQFTPCPRYILAIDNNSKEKDKARVPYLFSNSKVSFFHVQDEKRFGGLTGTWNFGIAQCLVNECDVIIIMNDDIIVNITWPYFIKYTTGLTVYGPLSNRPSLNPNCPQTATQSNTSNDITEVDSVNGFCMSFTKESFLNNMWDKEHFFSPELKYMWSGNEGEWQDRLKKKGIQPRIIRNAWVYHHKDASWRKHTDNDIDNFKKLILIQKQIKIEEHKPTSIILY